MRKPRKNTLLAPRQQRAARTRLGAALAAYIGLSALAVSLFHPQTAFSANNQTASPPALTAKAIKRHLDDFMTMYIKALPHQKGQDIRYTVDQLDVRVRLTPCDAPLSIEPYQRQSIRSAGKITLLVECDTPQRWRLFVPVSIRISDQVVVIQAATPRNTELTEAILGYQTVDVSTLRQDYFRDIASIRGFTTRQFLRQGTVISQRHITPPHVVRRNQQVMIVAQGEHLSVKTAGIALSDGKVGDWIRVKNTASQRIVEGRVTSAGNIEIAN